MFINLTILGAGEAGTLYMLFILGAGEAGTLYMLFILGAGEAGTLYMLFILGAGEAGTLYMLFILGAGEAGTLYMLFILGAGEAGTLYMLFILGAGEAGTLYMLFIHDCFIKLQKIKTRQGERRSQLNQLLVLNKQKLGNYIDGLVADSSISYEKALQNMRNNILTSVKTKFVTYMRLNSSITIHDVYKPCVNYIPEDERVSFTRFRLSSHKL